jgi:transposase
MFAIVAEQYQYVVGVDTHAQKHVATIVSSQGLVLATREVRVTGPQMNSFISWVRKVTDNAENVLLAIEGTSSYADQAGIGQWFCGCRSKATENEGAWWRR